ncbi:MAG: M6 family metalloprotease domain-containing protein [Muribaculaceae bacterium]|nr:M6 family metalloprotease domain-containing protein [Muribaculaceae bacterium]
MKRILLNAAAMMLITATAMGVPARRGTRTVTQADGTTITLRLVGDENFHIYTTADGHTVSMADDGNFHYILPDGQSAIVAHDETHRTEAEEAFLSANSQKLTVRSHSLPGRRRQQSKRVDSRADNTIEHIPTTGTRRIPVLLLEYSDYRFRDGEDAKNTFTEFFDSGNESARQYFIDQSNGKYTPQFDIFGPFTLSKKRSAYGGNDYQGYDKGVGAMVAEGCLGLDSEINFSNYDTDGDGECDVVIVIYAGDGEASSDDRDAANSIWPCQWELAESDYGRSLTLDGVKIDRFGVFNELSGFDLSQIDGIGTFCHEFSHCLGLPDFYCTDSYSDYFGMAHWSLMDYGCYNDDGYTPIGYSAYEKNYMGWIDYVTPQENTLYTLPVFNSKNADSDVAIKVSSPTNANEYYIIENRARQGWDRFMPAEGLLITHVTYDASKWYYNEVNNYSTQGMTIIPADNTLNYNSESSLAGDLWPYNGNDALTDTSTPAARLNLGNQPYMGKPITEMTRNADGTISLWYIRGALPRIETPAITSISHTTSSLTAEWQHTSPVDVTYTLQVRPHSDLESRHLMSADFTQADHGWSTANFTEVTTDGIRLGSGKQLGAITSPAFTPSESTVTLVLDAKNYGLDETTIRISSISGAGEIIESVNQPLTSTLESYILTLETTGNQPACIRVETTTTKKRAYIASATVYNGDVTAQLDGASRIQENRTGSLITIEGITSMSHTVENLEEGALYDIRLKAVPVSTDEYLDSDWTDFHTVDMSANTGTHITIAPSEHPAEEWFTVQGTPVAPSALLPGIYIRRSGNTTEKIVIR